MQARPPAQPDLDSAADSSTHESRPVPKHSLRDANNAMPPVTAPATSPGAHTVAYWMSPPAMIGAGIRVKLWIDVFRPRMPPTSSWVTALVSALVMIVLLTASPTERNGISRTSTGMFGAKPHAASASAAMMSDHSSRWSSSNRLRQAADQEELDEHREHADVREHERVGPGGEPERGDGPQREAALEDRVRDACREADPQQRADPGMLQRALERVGIEASARLGGDRLRRSSAESDSGTNTATSTMLIAASSAPAHAGAA